VRGGAVPGAGRAGVQGGLAGGGQSIHPPLGRGPGVLSPARRAERMHGGLDDLPGQGVSARPGNGARVIEGEPERQMPALELFALLFLDRIGIGAVEEFLAQAAQRARVQPRDPPPAQGTHQRLLPGRSRLVRCRVLVGGCLPARCVLVRGCRLVRCRFLAGRRLLARCRFPAGRRFPVRSRVLSSAMGQIGPLVTGCGQQQFLHNQRRRVVFDLAGGAADDMRGIKRQIPGH